MALIVENGSASSTAESFASVADADTYHSNRANDAWGLLTTAKKEAYLRKATDYMEGAYRLRWKGYKKTATQALSFPRSYVYLEPFVHGAVGSYPYLLSDSVVPQEVINACAELALKASTTELAPDLTATVASESVGSLSVTYATNGREYTKSRMVDMMLTPYLKDGSGAHIDLVGRG